MNRKAKFKQTEIGMIPEDWGADVLGNYTNLIKGISYRSEDYCSEDEGFIFINLKCVARNGGFREEGIKYYKGEFSEEQSVSPGDILIANTDLTQNREIIGSPLKVPNLKNDRKMCISLDLTKLDVISKKLNGDFLYYYLMSSRARHFMIANGNGTTVVHLSTKNVPNMVIPLPDIEEQKFIAKILSSLDDKIELNQTMNKTLEAIGQAIFKHWFIDFEFPNENGKPYQSSGGEMIDSEIGEIPKGWTVKPIDEVANFLNGLALQKYPATDDKEYLPVIKIRELKQGITEATDKAGVNLPGQYIINDGDVIFSWSGSLEVVIWTSGKGALNQHLFKVSSKDYPKWFYYLWVLQQLPEYRHIAEGKATTMGHIQRHHLKSSLVLVPDKTTITRMDKILSPIIDKIIEINVESKNISQIRDLLLSKLMSGKIRVPLEEVK